jgi:membrane associated rhomboid family serine protease
MRREPGFGTDGNNCHQERAVKPMKSNLYWMLGLILLVWLVEIVSLSMGYRLNEWGILPRSSRGLVGIPVSPFLHSGIGHVISNTSGFVLLGSVVMMRGRMLFLQLSLLIVLLGGGLTWALGRSAHHVGASGLIFGYFGYLLARAWYERTLSSIVIALVVLVIYGGVLWGLLPTDTQISWEGHVFGFLAGILGARLFRSRQKEEPS